MQSTARPQALTGAAPKTSLIEGGGPPAGGGRSTQAADGVKKNPLPNFICFICFIYIICPTHIRHMMFFSLFSRYFVLFPQTQPSETPPPVQPFSVK